MMSNLSSELSKLYAAYHKVLPIIEKADTPHEKSEEALMAAAKQPDIQLATKALTEFNAIVDEVDPFIAKVNNRLSDEGFKQRAIQSKGWLSQMADYPELLHGGKGLISDDFDDVKRALETLQKDINGIKATLAQANGAAAQPSLDVPTPTAATPAAAEPNLQEKLDQLMKGLSREEIQKLVEGIIPTK